MAERLIDLSLTFAKGMRGVDMQPVATLEERGYNSTNLLLYSHAGTHLDAPTHIFDGRRTVDDIALEKCIGPALVIDLTHKAPNSLVTIDDLAARAHRIGPKQRLLLRTDWDLHVGQDDYRTHFPRVSIKLAQWLVDQGIWLLGVESPSVASLQDREEMKAVHRVLLGSEIVIVEGLTNLRDLRHDDVYFVALPLKIDGCDGSPVRAVAIEQES